MQRLLFVLMTAVLALFALVPAAAEAQELGPGPHVAIRLEAETANPAAGSTVTLAFVARPDEGWHGYWKNPGDAGVETQLKWTLPEGVAAGPLQYPVPHRLLIAGLMNYVYEGPYAQLVELTLPAGLAAGTKLPVQVTMDYLVCTAEVCVPESKALSLDLTVGDGTVAPERRATFDGYRRLLPRPLSAAATWSVADGMFRLAVPFPGGAASREGYFYPLTNGAVDYAAPQLVSRRGDLLVVETKAATGKGVTGPVEGVLSLGGDGGFFVRAQAGAVAAAPADAGAGWATAIWAFGGAVLGGLLLNIMPCVFPILSLKALSLARAGETEAHARSEAVAYTAGVVLVCVGLGAVLLGLRAAGASAGWAFQLQDPRVILLLLLLTTAIALNLAGLFEVTTPGAVNRMAAEGRGGAFVTGALAAFIATPCTGPFMGAALGAALLLPALGALAVFAGLGLGLALPFLLLGFVPALRRRLPKPGAWMETFRHVLSVPMFLTALALAWVLGRQAGVDAMTLGLGAALLLGCGLWWTGRRQAAGLTRAWLPALPVAVLALLAAGTVRQAPAAATPSAAAVAGAEPFSEERLAALAAEGRPVFAYFTADWCLTCKVNEKAVIETAAVGEALKAGKVAVLVGDWTDGDPALGRFIEKHNRAGVPLYLWYKPGGGAPEVLPQLLTQDMLVRRTRAET